MEKRTIILLIIALLLFVGIVARIILFSSDDSLEQIKDSGIIRVGYAIEAPYAYVDSLGEVTGESPEIAKAIIKRMGNYKIEWVLSEFSSLIPDLQAGKIDVIAAGMFISKQREKQVSFSIPTFHVQPALLVLKNNPCNLHSFEDVLKIDSARIAVVDGAVEEQILTGIGFPSARINRFPDALSAKISVESGLNAGLALSSPTLQWMEKQDTSQRIMVASPFTVPVSYYRDNEGYGAFAFSKESKALLKEWNKQLTLFIGSPEYLNIQSRFGFNASELPDKNNVNQMLNPK
jgi:polar amino acid transport system substrate-binding protein